MKEMMAIIRETKFEATVKALEAAGFDVKAACSCMGRGKKSLGTQFFSAMSPYLNTSGVRDTHCLIPKHILVMYIEDDMVDTAIEIIMDINSTRNPGDGKIFVMPAEVGLAAGTVSEVA